MLAVRDNADFQSIVNGRSTSELGNIGSGKIIVLLFFFFFDEKPNFFQSGLLGWNLYPPGVYVCFLLTPSTTKVALECPSLF